MAGPIAHCLLRACEKVLVINADRELFGRLVIAAKSRVINLKMSLATSCQQCLEKMVDVHLKLPQVTTSTICIAHIFDAMALGHMTKSFGASTPDELALK